MFQGQQIGDLSLYKLWQHRFDVESSNIVSFFVCNRSRKMLLRRNVVETLSKLLL